MNPQHVKSLQLKYVIRKDDSLPVEQRVRRRPYILFTFEDPRTGRRWTKTRTIRHVDLHTDLEGGLAIAQEYFESLRRKLALDLLDLKTVFPTPNRITLRTFFGEYLEQRRRMVAQGRLAQSTLEADRYCFMRFRSVMGDDTPVAAIITEQVEHYVERLLATEYAPGRVYTPTTANIDLRTLRAAFNHAVRAGILERNPCEPVRQLRQEKLPRHLWPEEVEAFRGYFAELGIPYQSEIFEFDLATGLRVSEIEDAEAGKVKIERIGGAPAHFLHAWGRKTRLWRWVPVDDCWEIIERRRHLLARPEAVRDYVWGLSSVNMEAALARAAAGKLFFEVTGNTTIAQFIRRGRRRLKLDKKITPHCLRHTFAVRYLEEERGDIYSLSQIMGHTSVKTTEVYLSATPRLLRMRGRL